MTELPRRSVCDHCHHVAFPVKKLCPSCGRPSLRDEPLPADAVVYSVTSIPDGAGGTRHLALVHTGGVRLLAPVPAGQGPLHVGDAVRLQARTSPPGFEAVAAVAAVGAVQAVEAP
jgi:uncharacterized OB-fold protein